MANTGFQTQVNIVQAPGVLGDFCDHNPRATVDAGPGGLVAGQNGVVIGRFAWLDYSRVDQMNAAILVNNTGLGAPSGFVHREQQGLITAFLTSTGLTIPQGIMVTLHQAGGFFVKNEGSTYAQYGHKAYAKLSDGSIAFGVTATPPGGATLTSAALTAAANTFSVTASITGNVMTVTAVGSGSVYSGATMTGGTVVSGTKVLYQLLPLLTGEALLGIGRYGVSIGEQSVVSAALTGTYGILTVTTITGTIARGSVLSGNSTTAGTTVTDFITGTGTTGTYAVDIAQTQTPTAATNYVETKWIATSAGAAGELIKMSSWLLG